MDINNPNKEYHAAEHLIYSCQYHVIFCPKYRRRLLTDGIDVRLKELFLQIAKKYEFEILDMEVMPDHVHMIIDCNPRFGIYECVKKLKAETSKQVRDEFPVLTTRAPTLWTRGAFISSVGAVSLAVVEKYIADQKGK